MSENLGNLKLVETVLRIRDTVAAFKPTEPEDAPGNVGGSSEFIEELIANSRLTKPYCWVVPLLEYGDEINQDEGTQVRHALFAFIVCVDNTKQKGQGLGKKAPVVHDSIIAIQDAIERSLLEWEPASIRLDKPIEWRGRTFLGMDNLEAHYQIEFEITWVKFDPYYFPKQIRDIWIADNAGDIPGAKDIKEIAVRYNIDAGLIHTSLDDGYFAMPNENETPSLEEQAEAKAPATLLDVEEAEALTDIEHTQGGEGTPAVPFSRHGIGTEVIHKQDPPQP